MRIRETQATHKPHCNLHTRTHRPTLPCRAGVQAQEENEISMREEEELEVQGPEEDGWYPVMRLSDGQMGLVPASYIAHKPLFG